MNNMNKLLAFHNDPKIKEKYLDRVSQHEKLDEIIKGTYWSEGKGCAVGCTIEGSDHSRYEKELGIPTIIAYLEDELFEEMSNNKAKAFPRRFLEAIPVGADLSLVFAKLIVWEWEDPKHGLKVIPEIAEDKELVDCCEQVVALYKRVIDGETPEDDEWIELGISADEIYSASAGVRVRAWAGAWAGAWARTGVRTGVRAGVRVRAWARAWAWARVRAWARAWTGSGAEYEKKIKRIADKLIELLKEAK
jgi:hypothetical protein